MPIFKEKEKSKQVDRIVEQKVRGRVKRVIAEVLNFVKENPLTAEVVIDGWRAAANRKDGSNYKSREWGKSLLEWVSTPEGQESLQKHIENWKLGLKELEEISQENVIDLDKLRGVIDHGKMLDDHFHLTPEKYEKEIHRKLYDLINATGLSVALGLKDEDGVLSIKQVRGEVLRSLVKEFFLKNEGLDAKSLVNEIEKMTGEQMESTKRFNLKYRR